MNSFRHIQEATIYKVLIEIGHKIKRDQNFGGLRQLYRLFYEIYFDKYVSLVSVR